MISADLWSLQQALSSAMCNSKIQTLLRPALCRCGGVAWGDEGFALLYESWYKTRRSKVWMFAPGQRGQEKQILFDRDYEDAYSDPGSPALRRTHRSTYVIARLEGTGQLIMQGSPYLST